MAGITWNRRPASTGITDRNQWNTHQIVVAFDFAGELAEISKQTTSINQITHTDEDYAIAVAKVLLLPDADDYEIRPIISAICAIALLPKANHEYDVDTFHYCRHLLHHELCHVHDINKKIDALYGITPRDFYYGEDSLLGPLAEVCWSEYIANFLSSKTATSTNITRIVTSFVDAIKRTKSVIDSEILLYRYHANLNQLMNVFQRHGEYLVKISAYTMGYMDGLGVTLEELSLEASDIIPGSYFQSTWESMYKALQEMRSVYPEGWKSMTIYSNLVYALKNY